MTPQNNIYINGQWVPARGQETINVFNPATLESIALVQSASPADVDLAVKAASSAFLPWSTMPAQDRESYIRAIAEKIQDRKSEIASTITAEMGMPIQFCSPIQVEGPAEGMASYAHMAHFMNSKTDAGSSLVLKEPVGVCAFITPWNYPLHQIIGKCAPALAAGCTMVLKPSEITPLDAILFTEIIDEVGLPPGVFNLVQGTGTPVGEALVSHPLIDMVSFTGSTRAGTRISQLAAPDVKRVCLELGGKSPYIITPDADLSAAIEYGINDVMINSGQTCTALTRMLLPANRYEECVEMAVYFAESIQTGDPQQSDTFMGPLSSIIQKERVMEHIQKGIDEGARIVTGGLKTPGHLSRGAYVMPTLFADVDNRMTIAREEIFGPVISLIPYHDVDEAVMIANSTDYGLSSGVWAQTNEQAIAIGKQIRAGQVYINGGEFNYLAPFGGYKQSGNGREWGEHGLNEFIETKSMQFK